MVTTNLAGCRSSAAARRNAFSQPKIFLVPFCIDWQKGTKKQITEITFIAR